MITTPRHKYLYAGGTGGNPYDKSCPDGEIIEQISGRSGDMVDQICATCSGGTDLGCVGGMGGSSGWIKSSSNGFKSINVRAGQLVDNLLGFGGSGGNPKTLSCDPGFYVAGMHGRAGDMVDGFGIVCGVKKSEYCVDNLETPLCKDVSKEVLNKACAKSFSQACKDRHLEVDTPTLKNYCTNNLDETFCVQFKPPVADNTTVTPIANISGVSVSETGPSGIMKLLSNNWILLIIAAILGFFAYRQFGPQQQPMQAPPMQMQPMTAGR